MYKLLRKFLFRYDAEQVHHFSMNTLKWIHRVGGGFMLKRMFGAADSPVNFCGLTFRNPIGLAAGFDKNARYLRELENLGFGFIEIGTVTPLPQEGNEKPRLFRLPQDQAIINRMGFNNDGVLPVARRVRKFKSHGSKMIIGGNIGKNKFTPNEDAWKDYEACFLELADTVDYFVVNVSSPNTPGLRQLQAKDSLRKILTHLQGLNNKLKTKRPLLLKIAPDLNRQELDDILDLALEIELDGLVATNTTLLRENLVSPAKTETGGLSGKPLKDLSAQICDYIFQKTEGQIPLISSGGIFTRQEVNDRLRSGAGLVQIWTAFIYEGPGIVRKLLSKDAVKKNQ